VGGEWFPGEVKEASQVGTQGGKTGAVGDIRITPETPEEAQKGVNAKNGLEGGMKNIGGRTADWALRKEVKRGRSAVRAFGNQVLVGEVGTDTWGKGKETPE
jgi:hypothetical protein